MNLVLPLERMLEIRSARAVRSPLDGGSNPNPEQLAEQNRKIQGAIDSAQDRACAILSSRFQGRTINLALNPALEQTLAALAHAYVVGNGATGTSDDISQMEDRALGHFRRIADSLENLKFEEATPTDRNRPQMLISTRPEPAKFGPGFMGWRP